ncbi:MAG TPA: hypothetical protein VFN35_23865 [Ktedonobacteraceae bacterium]|nr:hypothetical protein [Ktedonobacteraceae bacterium]
MPETVMEKGEKEIKEAFKTIQKLSQSWYEIYQAAAQSAFDVQNSTMQYAQSVFVDGAEACRSHLDAFQKAAEPGNQQKQLPSLMENGIEAYKRNIIFLRRTLDHGAETFKRNTEIVHDLTQTLMKKAQEQHEIVWS